MRILVALPGLHRVHRGAEVALESVGRGLAQRGHEVTLLGSGHPRAGEPYRFLHSPVMPRERFERFPFGPTVRNEGAYEELTFAITASTRYRPADFDVTMTCGYPFTNWLLRRPSRRSPQHVFVTQNGDWPTWNARREFRFFGCDGLVCTNPVYFERNAARWPSALIPNGIDLDRFAPGPGDRAALGLPDGVPLVLMVSALIESKRVDATVRAVAALDGVHLAVAGDGSDRARIEALAAELLPGRFHRLSLPFERMPLLYRSADAFVHTTLAESFGNVYIEAAASGLPVVAHDSPITQWILGASDLLVDTEDHEALVDGLTRALQQSTPSGVVAPEDLERFSWSRVVERYDEFLAGVVRDR